MLKDQIKALGKLGSTKGGRKIIQEHRGAFCSILAESAAREAKR